MCDFCGCNYEIPEAYWRKQLKDTVPKEDLLKLIKRYEDRLHNKGFWNFLVEFKELLEINNGY